MTWGYAECLLTSTLVSHAGRWLVDAYAVAFGVLDEGDRPHHRSHVLGLLKDLAAGVANACQDSREVAPELK